MGVMVVERAQPASLPDVAGWSTIRTAPPHLSLCMHGTQCQTGGDLKTNSMHLQMRQWWGYESKANGSASNTLNSKADANAKWICRGSGTQTYIGSAFHQVVRGGKNYTGNASSGEARLYCN